MAASSSPDFERRVAKAEKEARKLLDEAQKKREWHGPSSYSVTEQGWEEVLRSERLKLEKANRELLKKNMDKYLEEQRYLDDEFRATEKREKDYVAFIRDARKAQNRVYNYNSATRMERAANYVNSLRWRSSTYVANGSVGVVNFAASGVFLVTGNFLASAITGAAAVVSAASLGLFRRHYKKQYREDTKKIWEQLNYSWGAAAMPDKSEREAIMQQLSKTGSVSWDGSNSRYSMEYDEDEKRVIYRRQGYSFSDDSQKDYKKLFRLWSVEATDKSEPYQLTKFIDQIGASLLRFQGKELDVYQQHESERLMRDALEALNTYTELVKVDGESDENRRLVVDVLKQLVAEAADMVDAEKNKLRSMIKSQSDFITERRAISNEITKDFR